MYFFTVFISRSFIFISSSFFAVVMAKDKLLVTIFCPPSSFFTLCDFMAYNKSSYFCVFYLWQRKFYLSLHPFPLFFDLSITFLSFLMQRDLKSFCQIFYFTNKFPSLVLTHTQKLQTKKRTNVAENTTVTIIF